jgi:hypothetical protein
LQPVAEEEERAAFPPAASYNFFSHISTATGDWLLHTGASATKEVAVDSRPGDHRAWLSSASASALLAQEDGGERPAAWLSSVSASALLAQEDGGERPAAPGCVLDNLRQAHSQLTMSDWLLGSGSGGGVGGGCCVDLEVSDSPQLSEKSWTACSSESWLSPSSLGAFSSSSSSSSEGSPHSLPSPSPSPLARSSQLQLVAATDLAAWIYKK